MPAAPTFGNVGGRPPAEDDSVYRLVYADDGPAPTYADENAANADAGGETFLLGVDVGIRNVGLALLSWRPRREPTLRLLAHFDAGPSCMAADRDVPLYARLHEVMGAVLRVAGSAGAARVRMGIEQQQKQTNDAHMVCVAGLLKAAFCAAHLDRFDRPPAADGIVSVQPSSQTSTHLQRRLLPAVRPTPVVRRADKKERAVAMLQGWLEAQGLGDVRADFDYILTRRGRGDKVLKAGDIRDHVADAFLCAYVLTA